MKEQTQFEAFKDKEFKGDFLLSLIVADILLERGVKRTNVRRESSKYLTNEHFATVFDSLGLAFTPIHLAFDLVPKPFKKKGSEVEYHFWNFFQEHGYEKTREYFRPFVAWPHSNTL